MLIGSSSGNDGSGLLSAATYSGTRSTRCWMRHRILTKRPAIVSKTIVTIPSCTSYG